MEDLLRWDVNYIIPDFVPNGKSCAARALAAASTAAAFFPLLPQRRAGRL